LNGWTAVDGVTIADATHRWDVAEMTTEWLTDPSAPILVAGRHGLVGSAISRRLLSDGYQNIIGPTHAELDYTDPTATADYVGDVRPEVLIIAAARVGGIGANDREPVDFLNENLKIQTSLFEAAHATSVPRVLFLGSSCIYPKLAPQPIPETALLTGPLEPTNEAYAIAKIAGITAVRSYRKQYGHAWISAMPTNLYGPGDSFDLESSHVLPALIRRFHEAKESSAPYVTLWGTGNPRREFLHSDDLASAVATILARYDGPDPVNVGCGEDISIRDLAILIRDAVGYTGDIRWDTSRPDGTPRKLLDVATLTAMGWQPSVRLEDGIAELYKWYLDRNA